MPSDYANPKCPNCRRCIDVHHDEERDEYYCPSRECQTYYNPSQVVP